MEYDSPIVLRSRESKKRKRGREREKRKKKRGTGGRGRPSKDRRRARGELILAHRLWLCDAPHLVSVGTSFELNSFCRPINCQFITPCLLLLLPSPLQYLAAVSVCFERAYETVSSCHPTNSDVDASVLEASLLLSSSPFFFH